MLGAAVSGESLQRLSCRHMKESKNAYDTDQPLHTFSIGLPGSPDLVAARRVAAFLGTQHHEFTFTVEEGIDALYDLIWHIESYEQVHGHPTALLESLSCCSPALSLLLRVQPSAAN